MSPEYDPAERVGAFCELITGPRKLEKGAIIYYRDFDCSHSTQTLHKYRFFIETPTGRHCITRHASVLVLSEYDTEAGTILSESSFYPYKVVSALGLILLGDGNAFEIEEQK